MTFRFATLLIVTLLLSLTASRAQDNDYLKHGKVFCLCAMHRECTLCAECQEDRYLLRIENRADKRITGVSYEFYSQVYNRFFEKEAKIEGDKIDMHLTGTLHICVPDGRHWIISKIVYEDGSAASFSLHGRMENFLQEPDECDCND